MSTCNVPQAAEILKVHENRVMQLIDRGDLPAAVRDHHHEAEQVALEANPVVAPVGVPSPEVHSGTIGHRTEGCAERVRIAFLDERLARAYPLGVGANNAGRDWRPEPQADKCRLARLFRLRALLNGLACEGSRRARRALVAGTPTFA